MPGAARAKSVFPLPGAQPSVRYAQKVIAFHFEFSSEIFENARYIMQTLYSLENLKIANKVLGRN
jgi:hypothetical protein